MNVRMRVLVVLVVLFTALSAGVLWWQSSLSQDQLRERVLMKAEQRSLHLAEAMAGQVEALFTTVDLSVQALRLQWAELDPAAFDVAARNALKALPPGYVSHVTVTDAAGLVVYSSLGSVPNMSLGERAYFKAMQTGGDRLVIGEAVLSRLSRQWQFVVGRPLLSKGRFVGTLHLAVSSDFMARKLAALELSKQDVVALIHANGGFLARSRGNAEAVGNPAPQALMVDPAQRSGISRFTDQEDGTPRTYGWYRLPQSGAVLAIGLADSSVLGPLAPALASAALVRTVLTSFLLVAGGLVAWLLWRVARSQAEALASEVRLKEAQQLAHVGSWELDLATGLLNWSDEVFRLFGLQPGSFKPSIRFFFEHVHPQDRERIQNRFEGALKSRELFNTVHRIVLPDGSIKQVRDLCVTEYDGELAVRIRGTLQDITEVSAARLALQQLNEELEQRVAQRTQALGELNRDLESFTYSVSHDLRTPLRSIHGFASLLQESEGEKLSGEGQDFLRRIQESSRRMGVLITDLLSMAQHSRAELRPEWVNLSAMARQVAAELERGEAQREVVWEIEPGLRAQADRTLMRVVLQNLLGNAWKYTGQTAQARIRLYGTGPEPDGQMGFCVSDNGAGFDMAYADQLFEPFKRLHRHQQFEGTGIGLATVARVLQRHGGRIQGEGAVGQGATFRFSLPILPDA